MEAAMVGHLHERVKRETDTTASAGRDTAWSDIEKA